MRFVLTIHLGNDAMQNYSQVAAALRQVSTALIGINARDLQPDTTDTGRILDDNGNRVGGWHVESTDA